MHRTLTGNTITYHSNADEQPHEAIDLNPPPPITQGVCDYCGEVNGIGFNVFYRQEQADVYVTNHCDCDEGARYRNVHEQQDTYNLMIEKIDRKREQHANGRSHISMEAKKTINLLFGDGAQAIGRVRLDDEALTFMHTAAMLIYDELIGGFSFRVAPDSIAKLGIKNGVLSIERQESTKQRMDVL